MTKFIGMILVLVGLLVAFFTGRYLGSSDVPLVAAARGREAQDVSVILRSLVLVVDRGEVYCGTARVPQEGATEFVFKTMQLNRAEAVMVYGTDTTRYGDVASLVTALHQRGIRIVTMATKSLPIGDRLDVIDAKTHVGVEFPK